MHGKLMVPFCPARRRGDHLHPLGTRRLQVASTCTSSVRTSSSVREHPPPSPLKPAPTAKLRPNAGDMCAAIPLEPEICFVLAQTGNAIRVARVKQGPRTWAQRGRRGAGRHSGHSRHKLLAWIPDLHLYLDRRSRHERGPLPSPCSSPAGVGSTDVKGPPCLRASSLSGPHTSLRSSPGVRRCSGHASEAGSRVCSKSNT